VELADWVDTDTRTVTIEGVEYRIEDSPTSHYRVYRVDDNGVVATINMLETNDGRQAFAATTFRGRDTITHDVAVRIARAARDSGLVR
jgi:hypothetical protein